MKSLSFVDQTHWLMRCHLAAWVIMVCLIPSRADAVMPMHMQITMADKQGKVWVYALVDMLEEANFSTQEKKEIYHLILEQELHPIGLEGVDALMEANIKKMKIFEAKFQPEVMAKIFSNLRIPYEKPFLKDKQLAVNTSEGALIKSFFMSHLYGDFAKRPQTVADLMAMRLGSTVLDSVKSTLEAWSAKKGNNTISTKTYEAVETSLKVTMERLSKDEELINEAWKFAVSRKFGE